MSIVFRIPDYLTTYTGQQTSITLADSPQTIGQALEMLWHQYPGLHDRMVDEQSQVRPQLNIFVCNDPIRQQEGLDTLLLSGTEVFILPAVGIA
jgi:molybdopterin converting factor small subunit